MTTLIQCVDSKQVGTHPAKELYQGNYFEAMKRYAKARDKPWYILSAKHGLVDPNDTLDYYDAFGLSDAQADEISEELVEMNVKSVHLIGGVEYTNALIPELERRGIDVIEIAQGLKIGERVSLLQRKARKLENHQLC